MRLQITVFTSSGVLLSLTPTYKDECKYNDGQPPRPRRHIGKARPDFGKSSSACVEGSQTYRYFPIPQPHSRMSAYGTISAPNSSADLQIRSWPLVGDLVLTTYPVYGSNAPREVIDYFHKVFNDELEGSSMVRVRGTRKTDGRWNDISSRGTT